MATNMIQAGDILTVTAPANVASGGVVSVGSLFGVAQTTALTGEEVEVCVAGVYTLPVASALVVAVGDPLYWDAADAELNDDSTNNPLVGFATTAAGATVTSVNVRLNGFAIVNAT